jgi:hypothetical protein
MTDESDADRIDSDADQIFVSGAAHSSCDNLGEQ